MSNINNCSICQPTQEETILIQDGLLDKLIAQKQQLKFADQAIQEISEDTQGFSRLLRIIFNKKFKNLKATRSCKHHFLKKEFTNKLKCNSKLLDFISNNISNKIAKYNFHMDTVSMQTKTFPRHFFNEATSTPPKVQKEIQKDSTEKKTEKIQANVPQRAEELQNHQKTQLKRQDPIVIPNTIPISSYMTPIIQFPQTYQSMYQPMNFSWAFSLPSDQFHPNNKKQKE